MVLRGVPRFAMPPGAVSGGEKESVRMSTRNLSSNMTRDRQRIAGIQKYFPATATLSIGNASYLQPAVIKVYQDDLDAETAVLVALAAYRTAVATAKTTRAKTASLDLLVKKLVVGSYGEPPGPAADFGFLPTVTHVTDASTKAQAAAKRKATREARGTLGSRQKLKITGTVPASATPVVTSSNGAAPATK
jgi:hypothetical protein